jgi:hypothetical protein
VWSGRSDGLGGLHCGCHPLELFGTEFTLQLIELLVLFPLGVLDD